MVQKAWSRNGPEVWSRKHGPEVWSRIAKNLKKKKKKKIYDLVRTSTSTSTSTFCGSNWKLLFMKIYNFFLHRFTIRTLAEHSALKVHLFHIL
jgi:hypothetical protein